MLHCMRCLQTRQASLSIGLPSYGVVLRIFTQSTAAHEKKFQDRVVATAAAATQ